MSMISKDTAAEASKRDGLVQDETSDLSADCIAYNEAWATFQAATKALEAAKTEFLRSSKVYEGMLRARIQAEAISASMTHPEDYSARVLRPVLRDAVLKDSDVVTFSDKHS